MAQKKKREKSPTKKSPDVRKRILNKTFIDKAYVAIKKILRAYNLDPDIFDQLTKNQRNVFILCETQSLKFKIAEDNHVPRQLIALLSSSTHHFLRNNYFGDRSIGLTYLELSTFGITFYSQLMVALEDNCFPPEQMEIVKTIAEKFAILPVYKALEPVGTHIRKSVQMISKVNFRIYGHCWLFAVLNGDDCIKSTVNIYSEECESTYFSYKNNYHKAFRVKAGRVNSEPSYGAIIDQWFISGKDIDETRYLNIYIQSHALQRVKERVDIFPAHRRNFYAMDTLLYMQEVVFSTNKRAMFECYYKDVLFGYYPFIVQDDNLFVLSFLPVLSPDTPKGAVFAKRLNIQKEDLIYLGMDKLSFFFTIDFAQIPMLHEALIEAGLCPLLDYVSEDLLPFEHDAKKTLRVKNFFEKALLSPEDDRS
ncbi:MAG: hypothetical protein LBT50_11525 [Prevotellaceae bacterium]|nr:hypothetical protein [Prevotellaceae bacterium]